MYIHIHVCLCTCIQINIWIYNAYTSYMYINEPWLTNEIIDLIFAKNCAWKRAKRTKNQNDLEEARLLRNRTKHVIRNAKANFVQDYLQNDRVSTKTFWEKINYVMPSKDRQCTIKLIDQETLEPIDNANLSTYINDFCVHIGPNLSSKFDNTWNDSLTIFCEIMMPDMTIDAFTLRRIIDNIDVYKSSAIQDISSIVLKDAFQTLLPQLVYMYSQ